MELTDCLLCWIERSSNMFPILPFCLLSLSLYWEIFILFVLYEFKTVGGLLQRIPKTTLVPPTHSSR